MENFTPVSSLTGGLLIGGAGGLLLLLNGRIAGISGILGEALSAPRGELVWRLAFIAGLVAGPLVVQDVLQRPIAVRIEASVPMLIAAGLLVGLGTRIGGGCTSGHGVCGIGRLSRRSIVATLSFLGAGAASVFVVRHLIGG